MHERPAARARLPGKNVYLAALLTMFLHASIPHLFGNMLFLWVFGNNIEDRKGWWRFLLLYLVGGAVATASQVAIDPSSTVPIIGASGRHRGRDGRLSRLLPEGPDQVDDLLRPACCCGR